MSIIQLTCPVIINTTTAPTLFAVSYIHPSRLKFVNLLDSSLFKLNKRRVWPCRGVVGLQAVCRRCQEAFNDNENRTGWGSVGIVPQPLRSRIKQGIEQHKAIV
jgi:hypothetical protein